MYSLSVRFWSIVSAFVILFFTLIGTVSLFFSSYIIENLFLLNHAIASDAAIYIFILLPSLWAFAIFRVQQKYLQAQNIMYPSTIILGIGNAFNYLFNYIFMYSIDMGYKGCALSTSLTKIIMLILMSLYLVSLTDKSFQKKLGKIISNKGNYIKMKCMNCFDKIRNNIMLVYEQYILRTDPNIIRRKLQDDQEVEMMNLLKVNDDSDNEEGNSNEINETKDNEISLDEIKISNTTDNKRIKVKPESRKTIQSWFLNTLQSSSIEAITNDDIGDSDENENSEFKIITWKTLLFAAIRYILIGIPGGLMLGLEAWMFDACIIFIAHMGTISLDVTAIILIICNFTYTAVPFAISTAATLRISNILGVDHAVSEISTINRSYTSAVISLFFCFGLMAVLSYTMYTLSGTIANIFTNDEWIIKRVITLAPLLSGFLAAYGLQGCAQGILRATGRQLTLVFMSLFSLWIVGLPLAVYLGFIIRPTLELKGFWIGLTTGMSCLALVMIILIFSIDWTLESHRAQLRVSKQKYGDALEYLAISRPGSLSYGGIPVFTSTAYNEEEEEEKLQLIAQQSLMNNINVELYDNSVTL